VFDNSRFRDYANVSKYYVDGKILTSLKLDMPEYNNEEQRVAGALAVNHVRPHIC